MANDWTISGRPDFASSNGSKARILLVDGHPLVREGLRRIIKNQEDLEFCGEAGTGMAAQNKSAALKPDLMTVDLRLPDGDGLDLLKVLKIRHPGLLMLVITQCDETLYAERALKAGARGYVMKERATSEILTAIRTVLAGGLHVSPKISALALHKMVGTRSGSHDHAIHNLTDRELQVLQLLGAGLGTRKASARLFLSVKTVETHRENIKHKLRLKNSAELVRFATEWVNGHPSQYLSNASSSGAAFNSPLIISSN